MTQDEIIEMAVQAGIAKVVAEVNIDIMESFANLVAAKVLAQPERPAPCARHCEATAFQITIRSLEAQLAQRTWVGLTDEDIDTLWKISRAALPRYATYASLIEAKLKEKNT